MNEALFNRNADACATARHPKCTCHCGGEFHGAKHSAAWRRETFDAITAAAAPPPEPDLFDGVGLPVAPL